MNVVISPAAKDDLLEIGLWIAQDNPRRADSFVEELLEVCGRLGDAPRGYPVVERYKQHRIRRCSYKNYLIFIALAANTSKSCISSIARATI